MEHVAQLSSFATSLADYHRQAIGILEELSRNLSDRSVVEHTIFPLFYQWLFTVDSNILQPLPFPHMCNTPACVSVSLFGEVIFSYLFIHRSAKAVASAKTKYEHRPVTDYRDAQNSNGSYAANPPSYSHGKLICLSCETLHVWVFLEYEIVFSLCDTEAAPAHYPVLPQRPSIKSKPCECDRWRPLRRNVKVSMLWLTLLHTCGALRRMHVCVTIKHLSNTEGLGLLQLCRILRTSLSWSEYQPCWRLQMYTFPISLLTSRMSDLPHWFFNPILITGVKIST